MKNLSEILICTIIRIVTLALVAGVIAFEALIIWGVGNAIIYLFALPTIWTYWQSVIVTLLILGIRKIFKFCFR